MSQGLLENFLDVMDDYTKSTNILNFTVALSGGIDSMALLFLIREYKNHNNKINFKAVTVNHNLRENSSDESLEIANYCSKISIDHQILNWEHDDLSGNIQSKARKKRYELITKWVLENFESTILTAHHLNDQIENILINLSQGSSIYGLLINDKVEINNATIFRPLIRFTKFELEKFVRENNIKFWQDDSNFSDKYLRNRIRNISNEFLELVQDDLKRVNKSVENIQRASNSLNNLSNNFLDEIEFSDLSYVKFNKISYAKLEEEIRLSVLYKIIIKIRNLDLKIRIKSLKILDENILNSQNFSKKNLLGCFIDQTKNKDKIVIYRFLDKNKPYDIYYNSEQIWDNRFLVHFKNNDKNFKISYLRFENFLEFKSQITDKLNFDNDLSYMQMRDILFSLPVVFENNNLISIPMLNLKFSEGEILDSIKIIQ